MFITQLRATWHSTELLTYSLRLTDTEQTGRLQAQNKPILCS